MVDMNDMIMTDSPIRFPGLFGDWTFTASSKAINVGHGVYWYGILIALGVLLALLLAKQGGGTCEFYHGPFVGNREQLVL